MCSPSCATSGTSATRRTWCGSGPAPRGGRRRRRRERRRCGCRTAARAPACIRAHPLAPSLSPPLILLQNITQEARSDADVLAVRSGGMPTRLGRTKTGLGGAAPAPSIG